MRTSKGVLGLVCFSLVPMTGCSHNMDNDTTYDPDAPREICSDLGDNDGDGLIDAEDPDCAGGPEPAPPPTPTMYSAPFV